MWNSKDIYRPPMDVFCPALWQGHTMKSLSMKILADGANYLEVRGRFNGAI